MRFAVIALVIVALVGAWTVLRDAGTLESGSDSAPRGVPRELPQGQDGLTAPTPQDAAPGEPADTLNPTVIPIPPEGPNFEINPQMRDEMVAYLVDSGLSVADSERIIESAFEDLTTCAQEALSNGEAEEAGLGEMERLNSDPAFQVCTQNVIQEHGLPFADPRDEP